MEERLINLLIFLGFITSITIISNRAIAAEEERIARLSDIEIISYR